jgi:hypothetical protein
MEKVKISPIDPYTFMDYVDVRSLPNMLTHWETLSKYRKLIENIQDDINMKIRLHMKERGWKQYRDEVTKINVVVDTITRKDVDREKLQAYLSEAQLNSVMKTTTFEKMTITTQEMRDRVNKMLKDKKV